MENINFFITQSTLNDIYLYFNDIENEKGGALLVDKRDNRIFRFVPLINISDNTKREFIFSFDELNNKIDCYLGDDNVEFIGIIHSHRYSSQPSKEDVDFYTNLIKENDYEYLLFPIFCYKNPSSIKWWLMKGDSIDEIEVKVVD